MQRLFKKKSTFVKLPLPEMMKSIDIFFLEKIGTTSTPFNFATCLSIFSLDERTPAYSCPRASLRFYSSEI